MRFTNNTVFNGLQVNATRTSSPIDLNQLIRMSAQVDLTTGAATGTVQLQVSNDVCSTGNAQTMVPTHWSNLGSAVNVTTGNTSLLISQQELCYRWLRAVYTDTSGGTGTAAITINFMFFSV